MRKYLLGLAAVLFPAVLLFPDGQGFARDWPNHVWMVGYHGEYLRQHGTFPVVANTAEVGGMTFSVFYGYLFYPLLGLFATHLHPEIVVRLAAVLLFAAQYVCVRKTMRRLKADENLAAGVACLTVWSVYALTNLYSRSALTEFFAVGVLTCAVCAWFDLLRAESVAAVWRRALWFVLLLTVAMGFHPLTGLYSLPLLPVLLFALPGRTVALRRLVPACAVSGVAAVVVLAPWVYAVRHFEKDMVIGDLTAEICDMSAHLDRWQTRLNPLPSDVRCDLESPTTVSTPYLDSQIGWPLLAFAAGFAGVLVWQNTTGRARLAAGVFLAAPVAYTLAMIYLSLHAKAFDNLPAAFKKVQFLYRIVSFVNIGILLVPLFALLWAARNRPAGAPRVAVSPVFLCFALTYAGFCVLLKLQHAEVSRVPPPETVKAFAAAGIDYRTGTGHRRWVKNAADRDSMARLPISSYGHATFVTPRYLPPLAPDEAARATACWLGVETRGGYFGENHRLTVTLDRPGYISTQVLVFPWNRFEVDGQAVPAAELRSWAGGPGVCTSIPVPAGTHTLLYRFEPDRKWRVLHRTSRIVLAVWVLAIAGLGAARLVRRRSPAAVPVAPPAPADVPVPLPKAA